MDTWHSEELIKDFHRELRVLGVSAQTATRHRDKMRFFYHAFIVEEWPRELHQVDSEIIRDFLGSWFLRNVGGSKSDICSYLATFKRFFEYLYNMGRLSEVEYDDLSCMLSSKDYFLACYDEYMNPGPDPWEDFSKKRGQLDDLDGFASGSGYGIDRQLWMVVKNLEKPVSPSILDFALFLDYVAHHGIKLTKKSRFIPMGHIRALNQRFSIPEDLPSRVRMRASKRIHWFFQLSMSLRLVRENNRGVLECTPRAEAFLDLDSDTQLAVLIDATWSWVPWSRLGPVDEKKLSDWAQDHREGFASLLADLGLGQAFYLNPIPDFENEEALLARYVLYHGVVEDAVMFALSECGLMVYRIEDGFKSLAMTRFGRAIMRLFSKRAMSGTRASGDPLEEMQENLLLLS